MLACLPFVPGDDDLQPLFKFLALTQSMPDRVSRALGWRQKVPEQLVNTGEGQGGGSIKQQHG